MRILFNRFVRTLLIVHVVFFLIFESTSTAQENKPDADSSADASFSAAETPPVRRIVFFNSGIAQIVHQGTVVDNQSVEISFDRDQIDDVLKSLVFDAESGIVESVQYQPAPGKESLAAQQLGPAMTLAQTLQSYRGESITLTQNGESITGSILGVETRATADTNEDIVTLVSQRGIQTYPLNQAETLEFDSEKVQEKFRLAMIGLTNARDVERKSLNMFFAGEKKRNIQFGYVVDAPVWRMTYRLDINEKAPTLQGWAHVDNVTGFDWKNVYIDLRSGRPQAFNVELFSPLVAQREHRDRSVFGIPQDLNLVAKYFGLEGRGFSFGEGQGGGGGVGGGGGFGGGGGGQGGGFGGGFGGGGTFGGSTPEQDQEARQPLEIGDGVSVAAAQGRASRMLQFAIEKPVNLASGRSAMLPILNQPVAIELLTRFDLTRSATVAELVAKMTNGNNFSIVAGPVTVYQEGGFVGDAELPRTDIGEKVVLPYGTDQPLALVVNVDKQEKIYKRVRLDNSKVHPAVVVERIDRVTRHFDFANKDSTARKIQLRLNSGLAKTDPKPAGLSNGVSEFEYELAANSQKKETIVFDTAAQEQLKLISIQPETLNHWKRADATIEPEVEKLLLEYFDLRAKVDELNSRKLELSQHINVLVEEQKRLTGIIEAVKTEASAEPFLKQLTEREKTLSTDRVEYGEVFRALNIAQQQLKDLLERDAAKENSPNRKNNNGKKGGGKFAPRP